MENFPYINTDRSDRFAPRLSDKWSVAHQQPSRRESSAGSAATFDFTDTISDQVTLLFVAHI